MREFERHQILQSRRMSGKRAATAESQLGVEGPEWAVLIGAIRSCAQDAAVAPMAAKSPESVRCCAAYECPLFAGGGLR